VSSPSAARVVAACLGLSGFAVAIMSGMAADNSADRVLLSAVIALIACQFVGIGIGSAAEVVLRERLAAAAAARESVPSVDKSVSKRTKSPQNGEVLPS
jgi:hypothetical protein